jgi:hypothetical protein
MDVALQSMPGNAFFILWSLIFVPTLTTRNLTEHETPFLPTRLVTIGAPAQEFVALSSVGAKDAVLELLLIRVAIAGSFEGAFGGPASLQAYESRDQDLNHRNLNWNVNASAKVDVPFFPRHGSRHRGYERINQ